MKIVIDIPDDFNVKNIENGSVAAKIVLKSVANGKRLPKGHGRLVDENDLVKDFNTFQDAFVVYVAHGVGFRVVCKAPTIVESDKDADNEK